MSPTNTTRKTAPKPAKNMTASGKADKGWTAEEKAAMREHAKEMRTAETREEEAQAVQEKIEEMQEPDRSTARRIHAIIQASAPDLLPRLWYGMPAYARDGKIVCFFQPAQKFKTRYSTLGFNDSAHLDEGAFWPVAYALTDLNAAEEARIGELIRKAVS